MLSLEEAESEKKDNQLAIIIESKPKNQAMNSNGSFNKALIDQDYNKRCSSDLQ